jgi:hypothetical protein
MYGMVNKAIEGLVTERFGEDTWFGVVERAGVEEESFISMDPYPDEVTYRLVGAASEILDTPPEALLEAFGVYWIKYVGQKGYGPMMDLEGQTLAEFLAGLDAMHSRVAAAMPKLRPPSFKLSIVSEQLYELGYYSERPGLGPMVVGLLKGLLEVKGLTGEVRWIGQKGESLDHDRFQIQLSG